MRILTLTALFAIGCGGLQVHGSDGGALPTTLSGQQLLAGEFTLAAVTSDGNALLLDANGDARAQPLGGGAATTFDSGSQLVVSSGPLGFSFHDYDPQVGFGTMSVWSSRGAAPNLAMNASYWQLAASSDGLVLVGTRNANLDGSAPSAEIFMSGFDGSNARTLWSGVSEAPGCLPLVGYLGSRFFVSHCPAGSTVATISTVDGSGAIVDLSSAATDSIRRRRRRDTRALVAHDGRGRGVGARRQRAAQPAHRHRQRHALERRQRGAGDQRPRAQPRRAGVGRDHELGEQRVAAARRLARF